MKSKKILLGSLSTMALVATPIATVVSCGDTKDTKVVATSEKGFVIEGYYIPEELASKAGSFKVKDHGDKEVEVKWEKALEDGKTIKVDGKDAKITKADKDHFVVPMKGKSGIGQYLSKNDIKGEMFGFLLGSKTLNITLPTEDKDSKKMVTKDGITTLNTYLKATGLVAESAELKKGEHDAEYFVINFKK